MIAGKLRFLWHRDCPQCGTPLEKERDEDTYACQYCGWKER